MRKLVVRAPTILDPKVRPFGEFDWEAALGILENIGFLLFCADDAGEVHVVYGPHTNTDNGTFLLANSKKLSNGFSPLVLCQFEAFGGKEPIIAAFLDEGRPQAMHVFRAFAEGLRKANRIAAEAKEGFEPVRFLHPRANAIDPESGEVRRLMPVGSSLVTYTFAKDGEFVPLATRFGFERVTAIAGGGEQQILALAVDDGDRRALEIFNLLTFAPTDSFNFPERVITAALCPTTGMLVCGTESGRIFYLRNSLVATFQEHGLSFTGLQCISHKPESDGTFYAHVDAAELGVRPAWGNFIPGAMGSYTQDDVSLKPGQRVRGFSPAGPLLIESDKGDAFRYVVS